MGEPALSTVGLRVCRAKVRGANSAARARRGLEAALEQCTGSAVGLPPRALLILARVAPSRPLRMSAAGTDPSFARALIAQLAHGRRAAVRPWTEPATGANGAVIFADESELAACVIRDWLRGDLGGRWWAASVLGGRGVDDWWRRGLLARGDLLPPVLARLAACGVAADWVRTLSSDDIDSATGCVARAHGLGTNSAMARATLVTTSGAVAAGDPQAARQLLARVPEAGACGEFIEHARLLGLSLGLMRDPEWVRRGGVDRAVRELRVRDGALKPVIAKPGAGASDDADAATTGRSRPGDAQALRHLAGMHGPESPLHHGGQASAPEHGSASRPASDAGSRAETGPAAPQVLEPRDDGLQTPAYIDGASAEADPLAKGRSEAKTPPESSLATVRITPEASSTAAAPEGPDDEVSDSAAGSPKTDAEQPKRLARAVGTAQDPAEPPWATGLVERYHTRFGGLFYLLNLALSLGLYPDFTRPRDAGIGLSPWDWLALVGRAWLGRALVADPIREVLRSLAVRNREQAPGADFAPPRDWLMPAHWPAPWGNCGSVTLRCDHGRLRLLHPAGFLLADLPRARRLGAVRQARRVLRRWPCLNGVELRHQGRWSAARLRRRSRQGSENRGGRPWQPIVSPAARWLDMLLPYLERRLALALGVDTPRAVRSLVCAHPARLDITSTALDIHLSLSDLPLAIRVAGLDRDPGWIPTAGRSIAFHFQ